MSKVTKERVILAKEKEDKDVTRNLNTGDADDRISMNGFLELKRRDYRSLTGVNHLNDKIVDEYLHLIQERSRKVQNLPSVYAMPVHAYTGLDEDFERNFEAVASWIKEDLEEKDMIFIPINKLEHWSLVVFRVKEKLLTYYDSILGTRKTSNALKKMKRFFTKYFTIKRKEIKIITKVEERASLQANSYDCGVFLCENAEILSRGKWARPKQDDMPKIRRRMMKELIHGSLDSEESTDSFEIMRETAVAQKKKQDPTTKKKDEEKPRENKKTKPKTEMIKRKERINWPKGNSPAWKSLDDDMSLLLKTLTASAEIRAKNNPNVIYGMCRERFGIKEVNQRKATQAGPSRRQRKCMDLREEINLLKNAVRDAPENEKEAIKELQREKLKKLRLAKRAETLRKNRKKFASNCKEFLSQPYNFARNLLSPKPKGDMESSKEEVEKFLEKAHSDPERDKIRERCEDLKEYALPEEDFNDKLPTFNEFAKKLSHTRSKSAPGPNGVPYLVYKRCPKVAKLLWGYLRELWRKNVVSDSWREAEGIFIPKEDGAKTVEKFRTISLLNVEGKLFFALKADRITEYVIKNNFINTSIQKGGIPNVSGCIEHTAILSQLIREAKKEKKNLVVTWLDIANAYGSIPHSVIISALEAAHVPEPVRNLVASYYSNVNIRFTTNNFTTKWQRVEKGIITGCTLSVILFSLSMSWLIDSVKNETKGPITSSGQRQANSRLFMDDITTTTEVVPQTKILLHKISGKLSWAGMEAKAEKCRSLVIRKGTVQRRELKIDKKVITPIQDKPVKYLGKEYKANLSEKEQILEVEKSLEAELKKIDKCKLPGRYKSWILQFMLLPRLMWPLTIYNIPASRVVEMQRKITAALKKWMSIPKNLSTSCMYSKSSKLKMPFTSLTEDFKVSKVRNLVTFQESNDPCIKGAEIEVDEGRKANTRKEIEEAKSKLRIQEITGIPNIGREGLGTRKAQYYSKSSDKERRQMIIKAVREKEEHQRVVNMTMLSQQGAHLKWEVPQRRLNQTDLIGMPEEKLKFLIKSIYDLLPTPANKNKWFDTNETCLLCGENGTLNHILAGCKVALKQGRYKWRHDRVLKELAAAIQGKIVVNEGREEEEMRKMIFIRAGEKGETKQVQQNSILSTAKDWKLSVDIGDKLKVPAPVAVTNLRPDITITSVKTKQMAIIELTVPTEERIEIAGELKRAKYEVLVSEGRRNGWHVRCWAVEIGCRGFPAVSMSRLLKELGFVGGERRKMMEKLGGLAEEASRSIWRASHYTNWGGN